MQYYITDTSRNKLINEEIKRHMEVEKDVLKYTAETSLICYGRVSFESMDKGSNRVELPGKTEKRKDRGGMKCMKEWREED